MTGDALAALARATAADAAAGDAVQAHDRATAARVLPVLERATADALAVLDALAALDSPAAPHHQESENYHNGKAP